jgi:hypothetical protein
LESEIEFVRCKTCHYSLANLTEHRCPECGTAFNPRDPGTFAHIVLVDLRLVLILLVVEWVAFAFFLWRNYEVVPFEPQQATPSAALDHAMIWAMVDAAMFAFLLPWVYVFAMLYRNRRFLRRS